MKKILLVLFVLSGVIPLLGVLGTPPDTALLIYFLYVVAWLWRKEFAALLTCAPGSASAQLISLFLISGSLTECFAWMNNYLKAAEEPAVFHPQLLADLIIGVGFYGGWALAWLLTLRWFRFQPWEAFVVTGIQGIFFEQLGAVVRVMLQVLPTNPVMALILGAYVFAVHGSAVGIPMIPMAQRFGSPEKSSHPIRFVVVIALMVGFAFAGCFLVGAIANLFGGLPPKRSIVEHPFW